MTEPKWLDVAELLTVHAEQQLAFGGPPGVRDLGALESALYRPVNPWHYEQVDLIGAAAAYGFGVARNHPFVDGNKRMAFIPLATFLDINAVTLRAEQDDVVAAILALAAGELSEAELAGVIRERWT